jgi:S1-C subfamily serine protease
MAMRTALCSLAVAGLLATLAPAARADDPPKKQGFVGIQIKKAEDDPEVTIVGVLEGSPAEKAGLKKDDVILWVGEVQATDLKTVVEAFRSVKPGDKVKVKVRRDGKEKDIEVTAKERPPEDE